MNCLLSYKRLFLQSMLFCLIFSYCFTGCTPQKFDEISEVALNTKDDVRIIGTFFKGYKKQAVIFAHDNIFSKESWYPLSKKFQEAGIASLTFDFRGSKELRPINTIHLDVLAALDFMKKKGVKKISIISAGMGSTAALKALSQPNDYPIDTIVLMAPSKGIPLKDGKIKKLFIVAKDDPVENAVEKIYISCAEPKFIKVFPGSLHAQHLFNSDLKTDIENYIIDYIKE